LPADGLARLSGEVAQLSALLARMADDIAHLDEKTTVLATLVRGQRDQGSDLAFHLESLGTAFRSDHGSVESQMSAIHQSIRHVEDAVVMTLGSKIESALADLLGALDHELSEQYERSVLESQRVTESLARLAPHGSAEVAPLRKGLAEMSRTLRKQVGEQLDQHGERHDTLDASMAQLLGEVTALKRRIPLRAGDAELSAGERERLAASIARLLLEEQPAPKRAAKSSRTVAASGAKAPTSRRRPPAG